MKKESLLELRKRLRDGSAAATAVARLASGVLIISATGGFTPSTSSEAISIVSASDVSPAEHVTNLGNEASENRSQAQTGWSQTFKDDEKPFSDNFSDGFHDWNDWHDGFTDWNK